MCRISTRAPTCTRLELFSTCCFPGESRLKAKQGQKQQLDELLRKLREEEPPRPSTRVGSDRRFASTIASSTIAEARGTEPRQLTRAAAWRS